MANIPDHLVLRGVKDVMQGDSQFDNAETGAKMPAGTRYGRYRFATKLISNFPEVGFRQFPEFFGRWSLIEIWRFHVFVSKSARRRGQPLILPSYNKTGEF